MSDFGGFLYLSELYDSGVSEIPLGVFIRANNRASSLYSTASPELRQRIAMFIYKLDLSMFKPWTIKDRAARNDYHAIIYLHIVKALESYKPPYSFISWLRFYVLKAREDYRNLHVTVTSELLTEVDVLCDLTTINNEPDSLLWAKVSSLISESDYLILQARVLDSLSMAEIASKYNLPQSYVSNRLASIFSILRKSLLNDGGKIKVKSQLNRCSSAILSDFGGGEWINFRDWCSRSGMSWSHCQALIALTPSRAKVIRAEDIDREVGKVRYLIGRLPRLEKRRKDAPKPDQGVGFS